MTHKTLNALARTLLVVTCTSSFVIGVDALADAKGNPSPRALTCPSTVLSKVRTTPVDLRVVYASGVPQAIHGYDFSFVGGATGRGASGHAGLYRLDANGPGRCGALFPTGVYILAVAQSDLWSSYTVSGKLTGPNIKDSPNRAGEFPSVKGIVVFTLTKPSSVPAVITLYVSLTPGVTTTTSSNGTISGTVTLASSGADLAGVCVVAYPPGGNSGAVSGTVAISNSKGQYTIEEIPPGEYDVEFFVTPCSPTVGGFAAQWYNATPSGASSVSGAVALTVTAGSATTGINASMSPAA